MDVSTCMMGSNRIESIDYHDDGDDHRSCRRGGSGRRPDAELLEEVRVVVEFLPDLLFCA